MHPTKKAADIVDESPKAPGLRPSKKKAARVFEIAAPEAGKPTFAIGKAVQAKFSAGATGVCPHCLEDIDGAPDEFGANLFLDQPN